MRILIGLLKDVFSGRNVVRPLEEPSSDKRVLNVGGGSKAIPIPGYYAGWRHDLLDIDPRGNPDVVCDARLLTSLPCKSYDAVYCSHNLEHYYRHHALSVVKGFFHILKEDGFAEIRVPDVARVIAEIRERQLDFDDVLYESAVGPISAHDVIYGLQSEIVSSGHDFYAHKTGFTPRSLCRLLEEGGFCKIFLDPSQYLEVHALAFKTEPSPEQCTMLGTSWKSLAI